MAASTKIKVNHDGVVSVNLKGENGKRIAKKLIALLRTTKK